MNHVLLEVCCGSADDVIEAYKAGADRVELNSDLFHGGLTPTVGTLAVAKRETDLPIMTMIRPREGGFCYTEAEFQVCLEDARTLLERGADGLVFGFLTSDGEIDLERTGMRQRLRGRRERKACFTGRLMWFPTGKGQSICLPSFTSPGFLPAVRHRASAMGRKRSEK